MSNAEMNSVWAQHGKTSRFCASGSCVEVASPPGSPDVYFRNNTMNPDTFLAFSRLAVGTFLEAVKAGDFDVPKGSEGSNGSSVQL